MKDDMPDLVAQMAKKVREIQRSEELEFTEAAMVLLVCFGYGASAFFREFFAMSEVMGKMMKGEYGNEN